MRAPSTGVGHQHRRPVAVAQQPHLLLPGEHLRRVPRRPEAHPAPVDQPDADPASGHDLADGHAFKRLIEQRLDALQPGHGERPQHGVPHDDTPE
ncbi:hypothetical protein [Amycolatopsis sp. NPDC051903]|uniref:hypothetical protein n=1 Tax=Amycolatopsis sp. NPDC051903 TaxID=3363936 RepID=UPI0037872BA0